jgi:hypothetical protein
LVGLIGAPILLASDIAVLFGLWDRISAPSRIAAIPIALWEFSLGVYLENDKLIWPHCAGLIWPHPGVGQVLAAPFLARVLVSR